MKKLLFIINPKAGHKKNKHFMDQAIKTFENSGYEVDIKYTKKRADGTRIAIKHGAEADLVVCMGGDGTLNEVMQGMVEGGVKTPLGYIPAGSTNDFATSLGLKTNPKEQAEFLMSHEPRPLDLGMFNGRYFVYTASSGIFTKTSYDTPQNLKNKLGHFAYILSGVKELFHVRKIRMSIELKDRTIEGTYIFTAINNATKIGGVMKLDESIVQFNDGVFELMLVEWPKDPIKLNKILWRIITRKFAGEITFIQIDSAKITSETDLDWSLDGEKEKGKEFVDFKVVHDAINFIY